MDEQAGNFADETTEMVSESAAHQSEELRKRRSTRIVQAVPMAVTGVDALGRPFTERTSTLIINCHGCRYQSKHYVLKNMWVTLEVPHPEAGQPARVVRGRIAWIQRPRTVRQLFQVALELEVPGNAWGIAFPPQDWFAFPEGGQPAGAVEGAHPAAPSPAEPAEIHLPLTEPEAPASATEDNLRVFPAPVSATDASLQLARHMARLVADAKQQIQAAAREVAAQAVAAEHRVSMEEWGQKFAAAQEELTRQLSSAVEKIQEESDTRSRAAHAAAAEALQRELPRWIAPQLEELTRELTKQISDRGAAERSEHAQQLAKAIETLQTLSREAQDAAARLRTQAEQAESQIAARAEAATKSVEEAARQQEAAAGARRETLSAAASQIQEQVSNTLAASQTSWREQLNSELEAAQARWKSAMELALTTAQERAAGGLSEHARLLLTQVQEEAGRQATAVRESFSGVAGEAEQKLAALRNSLEEQSRRLEAALSRASEASEHLDQFSQRIDSTQQLALGTFQSQLDDVLSLHRNELHRNSESLLEEITSRIQNSFEEALRSTVSRFDAEIDALVRPHVSKTEEAIQRLAGGRSLLDAALTLQQDRIRAAADEAFAESLARFRENLGGVDQILQESAQSVTARNLAELESKASDLKHVTIEDLMKSAEWYEKKAQTQIQSLTEKAAEQAASQLREKAGEISGVFASELDHSSRSFIQHTQTQMEEVVRDSFERARALFAEAADTTSAAFTDEIQRHARQDLDGFDEELLRSMAESRAQIEAAREEMTLKLTAEQEEFLSRFRAGMSGAVEAGVADANHRVQAGFAPLLDSWKSMVETHQATMRSVYAEMSQQAAEHHRTRLENVSNQWMLATAASLDHQSREAVAGIAAKAEEKLRETCAQVFAGVGETLKERMQQIAASFTVAPPPMARSQTAGGSSS
jgi:hypothetical protein